MSAATDYRQILQGGEQANQAVVWDWFSTNTNPIEDRTAPSGQEWSVIAGGENKVQTTGGTMRLTAGNEAATVYPFLVSPTNITVLGAEFEFVSAGGATHDASAVIIISQSTVLATSPFIHGTVAANGNCVLDWYAAGLNGGLTATTNVVGTFVLSQTYNMQLMVEPNGTVTFLSPLGKLQLTGLTIPGNMVIGIWEFTNNGSDLKNALRYHKAWAGPLFANMLGQTSQAYSGILDKLAGGRATTLNAVTMTASGNITVAAGSAVRVPIHAAFANGGVSFTNAAGTAQAMIFGLGADDQGYWNLPSGGDMHLYNNAGNIQLFRWIASTGDFEVSFTGAGLVMKSPNAARWRLTVSNAGVLGATAL